MKQITIKSLSMSRKIIAYVNLGDGWLDNDYTIYNDGSVLHEWDQHPTKYGLTEEIRIEQISEHKLAKILAKCSEEQKAMIMALL